MRISSILALLGLLLAGAGAEAADSALEAETLVRQLYYEGIPYGKVQGLDARAVARLGAMLREPSLAEYHANIVMALGMSGHPDAFALLAEYAALPVSGEVDRATFRTRTRLARAMGYLARKDPRALHWLLRRAEQPATAPAWHFRQHRDERLTVLLEEQLLTGLALSGAREAEEPLRRAAQRARGADTLDQRLRHHAEQAWRVHQRVSRDGVDASRGKQGR
jgi:hypothetical protein